MLSSQGDNKFEGETLNQLGIGLRSTMIMDFQFLNAIRINHITKVKSLNCDLLIQTQNVIQKEMSEPL